MGDDRDEILASLEPLFEEAERTGKWFYWAHQDIWFSPAELREQHAKGMFVWGRTNWRLRDPEERARELRAAVTAAQAEYDRFLTRIQGVRT